MPGSGSGFAVLGKFGGFKNAREQAKAKANVKRARQASKVIKGLGSLHAFRQPQQFTGGKGRSAAALKGAMTRMVNKANRTFALAQRSGKAKAYRQGLAARKATGQSLRRFGKKTT